MIETKKKNSRVIETHFIFEDNDCNSINPEVLIAYEQYLVEYCKYHKCELKFLPSRPGSFIVDFIILAATNIAIGFFRKVGEDK